ncbi:hypothetical protein [Gramella sp. AN32]|uniref:Uncharacterized protein n=1 Tax=Christiangramia antarctica TaxID=2058158 RepID=A0ABW5X7Z5_9FLAO
MIIATTTLGTEISDYLDRTCIPVISMEALFFLPVWF